MPVFKINQRWYILPPPQKKKKKVDSININLISVGKFVAKYNKVTDCTRQRRWYSE